MGSWGVGITIANKKKGKEQELAFNVHFKNMY